MPQSDVVTSDFLYIRLEGDRSKVKGTLGKIEADKTEGLKMWAEKIKPCLSKNMEVYGYFGKYYSGYPPSDVNSLLKLLSITLFRNKMQNLEVKNMFFKQIQQHGDNFSYIIADENTNEAAVVDSSFNSGEIIKILKAKKFNLKYIINTHGHSDHTAGNIELKSIFGAKIVAHKLSKVNFDIAVEDGDVLNVGKVSIKVIYTPGHSLDSICILVDNKKLLTGDTLFVGECGRTDFPGGNSKNMYDSLFNKLLKLDDATEVYPGHDYGLKSSSTIGEEKKSNYVLQPRNVEDFIDIYEPALGARLFLNLANKTITIPKMISAKIGTSMIG